MVAPFASGVPSVIVAALIVELIPPPFGCVGGASTVVPSTVAFPPPVSAAII